MVWEAPGAEPVLCFEAIDLLGLDEVDTAMGWGQGGSGAHRSELVTCSPTVLEASFRNL